MTSAALDRIKLTRHCLAVFSKRRNRMTCRTILGRILACGAIVATTLGLSTAVQAAESTRVAVAAKGVLPGIPDADLNAYLVKAMAATGSNWRFEPAAVGRIPPPYRIEWSFKANSAAASSVRSFGFSGAAMQRLLGTRHYLTIEATLYLQGEYQTQTIGQVSVLGGAGDRDLVAEIERDTRQLMAYPTMDTRSELSSQVSHRRI
jgi:hypothetical protein